MTAPAAGGEWDRLPVDPDLHRHLDYGVVDLDVFGHDDEVVVVASEEDIEDEDAFVVVSESTLCDPLEWR